MNEQLSLTLRVPTPESDTRENMIETFARDLGWLLASMRAAGVSEGDVTYVSVDFVVHVEGSFIWQFPAWSECVAAGEAQAPEVEIASWVRLLESIAVLMRRVIDVSPRDHRMKPRTSAADVIESVRDGFIRGYQPRTR